MKRKCCELSTNCVNGIKVNKVVVDGGDNTNNAGGGNIVIGGASVVKGVNVEKK